MTKGRPGLLEARIGAPNESSATALVSPISIKARQIATAEEKVEGGGALPVILG
jgi:hypothetical protein